MLKIEKNIKKVILIVIDALRPDHLGCYGYERNTSPTIDSLARAGVKFNNYYCQGIYTFPSFVSLFTSVHECAHRLKNGAILNFDAKTMAEYFKENGYTTAAFVSNAMVKGDTGLRRGFDVYDDKFTHSREASLTFKSFQQWYRENAGKKSFVFIHFNDCHAPYTPPAPYSELFINDEVFQRQSGIKLKVSQDNKARKYEIPKYAVIEGRNEMNFYISQYDGAIRYIDDHIKNIIEMLKEYNDLEDSLLIITADHGEAMGEHGIFFNHGKAVYEEFIRIPLIIYAPSIIQCDFSETDDIYSNIDLLPTLSRLLRFFDTNRFQGRAMFETRKEIYVFGSTEYYDYIIKDGWKYIRHRSIRKDKNKFKMKLRKLKYNILRLVDRNFEPLESLFNLKQASREKDNFFKRHREKVKELSHLLDLKIEEYRNDFLSKFNKLDIKRDSEAHKREIEERLKSLGYL